MMKIFYIKSLIFVVLILISIKVVDSFIVQDELFHTTYKRVFTDKEEFDFVFLGNSLSQRSYNSAFIDSSLNTKSINLGSSGQHFYITNEIFKSLINSEDLHPKKALIISISPWQFKNFDDETWKFIQMAALDEIDYSLNYFRIIGQFYNVSEYPKVLSTSVRFHSKFADNLSETDRRLTNFSKNIVNGFELDVERKLDEKQRFQKRNLLEKASEYNGQMSQSEAEKISEKAEEIILDIIKACKEQNINVFFVTPPAINMIYEKEDYGKIKYLEELFTSQNINYLNFNSHFLDLGLGYDDYSDFSHLNKYGSLKIAPFLTSYMTENFKIKKNIKKAENKSNPKDSERNKSSFILVEIGNVSSFENNRTSLKPTEDSFDGNSVFNLSRISRETSSFLSTKPIVVNNNQLYRAKIVVKKGSKGNLFGFRIQGEYPNRVDAVFDLENAKLVESKSSAGFKSEEASIKKLNNGWFECSITAKVNTSKIRLIMGTTESYKTTTGWEGVTSDLSDVYIVPSKWSLEEIIK